MHQSIPTAPISPPPPPPHGQLRDICAHCQSRGSGINLLQGYPRHFDTHVVSDSKSKHGRFYRKRPVVCHRLACLSKSGENCGVLSGMFPRFYVIFSWLIKPQFELSLYTEA